MMSEEKRQFGYEMADPILYEKLKEFAIENRKKPTEAESVLWEYLKGKQTGYSFRRQHIIGTFIADFACLSRKLIVEIDGGYHQLPDQQISDEQRTEWIENRGFYVMRFTNEEVIGNIEAVLNKIKQYIINERI
jgi:methylmalonyl-CoA mutase